MSDIKTFLKALQKSDYPNSSINVPTIARLVDYPIESFLYDLYKTIGKEKTNDFVQNTFSKLNATTSGVEIDLTNTVGDVGSYIFLIINGFDVVYDSFEEDEVWIHYSWGPAEIILDGEVKTLEDLYDEVGLGELGEWGEFIDEIQQTCIEYMYEKTGFLIHFDSQI